MTRYSAVTCSFGLAGLPTLCCTPWSCCLTCLWLIIPVPKMWQFQLSRWCWVTISPKAFVFELKEQLTWHGNAVVSQRLCNLKNNHLESQLEMLDLKEIIFNCNYNYSNYQLPPCCFISLYPLMSPLTLFDLSRCFHCALYLTESHFLCWESCFKMNISHIWNWIWQTHWFDLTAKNKWQIKWLVKFWVFGPLRSL